MWIIIILLIVFVAAGVTLWIRHSIKLTEQKKYYDAAARMLKEDCLDQIIQSHGKKRRGSGKIMIYLRVSGGEKQGFVFDPEKGIRIGRIQEGNEICIRDMRVSACHCCIYLYQGEPVIQDFNSSNGTWVKRGMRKHMVEGTERIFSGDKLMIGSTKLGIQFFQFDMTQL